jgi:uncharacterized membrane protein
MKHRLWPFALLLFLLCAVPAPASERAPSERASDFAALLQQRGTAPLLITGFISMLPVFELRGGIPVGIAVLKQNPAAVYLIAVAFNLIPVVPLLLFLNPIKRALERIPLFAGFFRLMVSRAERNRTLIQRYEEFGLLLFVAVPLPVTGAWTGSLIAVVLGLRTAKSFLFIALGVVTAGGFVTAVTLLGKLGLLIVSVLLVSAASVTVFRYLKKSGD